MRVGYEQCSLLVEELAGCATLELAGGGHRARPIRPEDDAAAGVGGGGGCATLSFRSVAFFCIFLVLSASFLFLFKLKRPPCL